jgi:hypothetical protein
LGTAGGSAARRAAPPPVVNPDNATEWTLGALRETLAAVSALPILTVVFIFFVADEARNLGLTNYAAVAASGWACIAVPLLLGLLPAVSWFLLALRKGPIAVRLTGGMSATQVVLPVAIQIIVLQLLLLLWADNYFPELADSTEVAFGFLMMLWPLAFYGLLLLYCFLPKTRGFLVLADGQATKPQASRAPGAVWGLGVTAMAVLALALQAPLWSLSGDRALMWKSFFIAEWTAALGVGFIEVLVLLAIPAKREAAH